MRLAAGGFWGLILGLGFALLLLFDALVLMVLTSVFDLDDRGVNFAGVTIAVVTAAVVPFVIPEYIAAVTSLFV